MVSTEPEEKICGRARPGYTFIGRFSISGKGATLRSLGRKKRASIASKCPG